MMPVIRIPDSVYERLQKHAAPFVDTPATVIERLLNAYETTLPRSAREAILPDSTLRETKANAPLDQEKPSDVLEATEDAPVTAAGKPVPEAWLEIVHFLFEQKAFDAETAVSKQTCRKQGKCGPRGYGELEETTPQLIQSCKVIGQRGWSFHLTPEGKKLASKG